MVILWPLLVVGVAVVVHRRSGVSGGRGWRWSLGWSTAGFLWSFSLVTGFSVGLALLPVTAAVMAWVARRSPHPLEALGFLGGLAVTAAVVAALSV